jgi:hypothetical protein
MAIAALGIAVVLGRGSAGTAAGSEPGKPAAPYAVSPTPRGGMLVKSEHHQFEVFFYKTGLRVFPGAAAGKPVATTSLTGTATFEVPGAAKPLVYPLATAAGSASAPGSIDLALDLSKLPAAGTKVSFQINGLPDPAEPSAVFTLPFTLTATSAAAVPRRNVPATLSIARSTTADQPAINAQRVCKVSGESLGSMGAPIKVTRGDRSVFLCCQGCIKRIQANPDQYLGPG